MNPLHTYFVKVIGQYENPVSLEDLARDNHQFGALPEKQVMKVLRTLEKKGLISYDGKHVSKRESV